MSSIRLGDRERQLAAAGQEAPGVGDGSRERLRQAQQEPAGWCGCCATLVLTD